MDIECEAGCGVLPFRYRDGTWSTRCNGAIGLELFLLIEDPWRVFLTTDHPNGAPFTTYPHLIRLLMDRSFRNDMLATIHKGARAMSARRHRPRVQPLRDRDPHPRRPGPRSWASTGARPSRPRCRGRRHGLATPLFVFKNGELIVRDGRIVKVVNGATHVARPQYDGAIARELEDYFARYHTVRMENFRLSDEEIIDGGRGALVIQPTAPRAR